MVSPEQKNRKKNSRREKVTPWGHTRPRETLHWTLLKVVSGFTDAGEYLAGTIRDLNEALLTNQQMSSEDEEVLEESTDIQDESALYFGAERIPDDEEQVFAEQDQSHSDLAEESEYEGVQSDSDCEID